MTTEKPLPKNTQGTNTASSRIEPAEARGLRLIQSLGYRLWWHLPRMFNPDNFRRDRENVFGKLVSVNMLCFPQEVPVTVGLTEIKTPEDDWRNADGA